MKPASLELTTFAWNILATIPASRYPEKTPIENRLCSYLAFLTRFRREAREKAVDARHASRGVLRTGAEAYSNGTSSTAAVESV